MVSVNFEKNNIKLKEDCKTTKKTYFSFSSISFYIIVTYLPKMSSVQVQPIRQVDNVGLKT